LAGFDKRGRVGEDQENAGNTVNFIKSTPQARMHRIASILLLAFLLSPAIALADTCDRCVEGQYFRVSALAFKNQDSGIRYQPNPAVASTKLNGSDLAFDTGYAFSLAYGFHSGQYLNTELEFSGRFVGLDALTTPAVTAPAAGDLRAFSFMLNVPWQFRNSTPFTPYLGGGLGLSWNRAEIDPLPDGSTMFSKGEQWNLTYQILAGIAFAVDETWELVLGYRFYGSTNPEYGAIILENRSHNVELGVRFYLPEKKPADKKQKAAQQKRPRRGRAPRR